jgi:tungstate transport system ATP-binding protein
MTPAHLLELRDVLVRRGGAEVLDVPRFHLDEGELVALIGPNGSGKTTLLLALMALVPRARGQLLYRGEEVRSRRDALACRRRMAMVLQEPLLFDTTVRGNVAAGLKLRGVRRAERAARVAAALERLGIAHLADRSARKLSGGEARRVSLARALAVQPDVLFLDEPFANLDAPTRQAIVDDLERSIAATRIAAILVTHDPGEAFRLARRFVAIDGGRVAQSGSPAELLRGPVNPFVASFVGMETLAEGEVVRREAGQLIIAVGATEIAALGDAGVGERVSFGVRPEHVRVDPGGSRAAAGPNALAARVTAVVAAGPFIKLRLDGPLAVTAYLSTEAYAARRLEVGAEVTASFDAEAVHLLGR